MILTGQAEASPPECSFGGIHYVWVQPRYFENNGGYCPTGRDCTGAFYRESDYHRDRLFVTGRVVILHEATNIVLWEGADDSIPTIDDTVFPFCIKGTAIRAVLFYQQRDGAFLLVDGEGAVLREYSPPVLAATSGDTFLAFTTGNAAEPNPLPNIFAAAQLGWNRLDDSGFSPKI